MEIKKGEGDGGKTRRKRTTRTAKEAKKRWRKNVRAKDIDVPPSPMRWEGEEEKVTSTLVENIRALSNARFQKMEEGEPPGAVRFTARIAKKFLLRHSTPDPTFSASAKLGFGSTRTRGWGRGRAELEPNRSERWIFSLGTDYRRPTDIACRLGRPSTELYGEKDRPNARSWPDLRIRYPGVSLNLEHLFNRTVPNGRIKILLENVVSIPQDHLAVWFLSQ